MVTGALFPDPTNCLHRCAEYIESRTPSKLASHDGRPGAKDLQPLNEL